MTGAAILALGLKEAGISSLWLIAVGLLIGWIINERERRRIKSEIAARRAAA
jgi:ABC-type molybdate transport system permease subunit